MIDRRTFLGTALGTTVSHVGLGLAAGAAGLVLLPDETEAAGGPINLPAWRYGNSSVAKDTVLMFRGNGEHTFYGTGPLPDTTPKVHWRFKTAVIRNTVRGTPMIWTGTGWTGTAVKIGDYVFVGSVGGYVYAFHAETGKLHWKLRGGGMFKGSLCAYRNRLYIGNTDDNLRCIDAATGKVLWRHNTGRDLDSSPCVIDGKLYIAGENGHLRCLDPMTGKLYWKRFVGGIGPGTVPGSNGSETSPAVSNGEAYTATYDGILFSIDAKTGAVRWKAKTGDDTDASPVIHDEFVYAAAEEKAPYLYCFARDNGREVWRYDGKAKGYYSTPAIVGDRIWVGAEDNRLHCVSARSGKPIWTFRTRGAIWSSPCVVDGKVVFGSRDFHLYCLDAQSGREIWKLKLDGRIISSPCIVGGKIWIGTATGYFYCIGA
ncbi:MAG: PQQ-binding-like beta-propeller repeat protein [Hyphomicrobiaceae bacterium]|nr:PQQ-binding-like beta-propeller repeat protein [Hyphomicrobiaceae bacterium]